MEDLKKENERLKKKVNALEKQLYAFYKERDDNKSGDLVTDYQKEIDEHIQ